MVTKRPYSRGGSLRTRPWWRPLAYSAATVAAIGMLFSPLPASAAPVVPPAVPDTGSRPLPTGALTMPGQSAGTTPITTPIVSPGVATTPLMAKVEKGRNELTTLGEKLTRTKEDVDLSTQQLTTADQKVIQTSAALAMAQREAADAAAAAVRDAAAMPPGTLGSGLSDLDSLARINRGDAATEQAASRQLAIAQDAYTGALAEQQGVRAHLDRIAADRTKLQAQVDKKSAAQLKLEQKYDAEVRAADAANAARDAQAGAGYLAGERAGRGADSRAIAALNFALAQRGDPYVWSEEGPDEYDCSGLMYAAYRSDAAGNFPLMRVSRDQYNQTHERAVDRYSLLPGDLLFFSSSNSWTGIHHVAMYAGRGMMVEAPRTGLNVRLTPVRWTRLFGATRIYGSIEGTVEGPVLGNPDPEAPSDHPSKTKPPTKPTTKPPTKPTTKPPTTPPTTKPTTKPTTPPTTKPTTPPTTTPPATTTPPPTTEPAAPTPTETSANSPTGSPADSQETSSSTSSSVSTSEATAAASKSAAPSTSSSGR
ncbi:NlpC/P60 family protein [Actinoplanes sp. NPDC026623]|uniref:C40 family peptidase n=1 Tax=Actinoplanes sp. NPDC026623 TaxID=3155610 RepID=UPI0033E68ACA